MVHPRPCCAPRAGGVDRGASETVPSAEERRAEAAAADVLAASGAGAVAKTAIGVAGRLRRQWLHHSGQGGSQDLAEARRLFGLAEGNSTIANFGGRYTCLNCDVDGRGRGRATCGSRAQLQGKRFSACHECIRTGHRCT